MNYIVFDLEWNQSMGGHDTENPRIPFEIIEIGAVKLDQDYNLIDSFSRIIKPRIYKRLQPHIKAILNYDESTLRKGKPFDMVCREFLKWCGKDYIFCSWGTMDLNYLQNNMDYYYMNPFSTPQKYYNIQQIYADIIDKGHSSVKLEKAVKELNIEIDENKPFHSAVNDAFYTGEILKAISPKDLADRYCYDVYNNPKAKEDEIFSYHKNYMEHISRGFDSKKDLFTDKDLLTVRCYKCNKKTSKRVKWFSNTSNTELCVCKCWYHGLQIGKIRVKQSKDNKYFAIKTVTPTNKQGLEDIKKRQDDLRIKRQIKRHDKKNTVNNSVDI